MVAVRAWWCQHGLFTKAAWADGGFQCEKWKSQSGACETDGGEFFFFCFKMTKNDRSRCFEMFSCVYLTACVSFWFPSNTNKSFTSKNADELYESLKKKKFKNKLHECKLSVIVQTVWVYDDYFKYRELGLTSLQKKANWYFRSTIKVTFKMTSLQFYNEKSV